MFTKITRNNLPPEGEEVIFLTKRDKERVLGNLQYCEDLKNGRPVPFVRIKTFSSLAIGHEILDLGYVTHWAEAPDFPIEQEVKRVDLLDIDIDIPEHEETETDRFYLLDMDE